MTTERRRRSLMDDSEFVAELEQIEHTDAAAASDEKFESRMSALDRGLSRGAQEDVGEEQWALPEPPRSFEEPPSEPTADSPSSRAHIALAVGGFLLMVALGAAAAAFIFHDRFAQLFGK